MEEILSELLEAEVEKLTQAARYERNEQRQGYHSGHWLYQTMTNSFKLSRCKIPENQLFPRILNTFEVESALAELGSTAGSLQAVLLIFLR